MSKFARINKIRQLLKDEIINSQEMLTRRLREEGFPATQTTVSRDLVELNAVKVKGSNGKRYYRVPSQEPSTSELSNLKRVVSEWVSHVEPSGNLIVMRTPPGCAHVVAAALDRSSLDNVIGTLAGDDTIIIVVKEGKSAQELAMFIANLGR